MRWRGSARQSLSVLKSKFQDTRRDDNTPVTHAAVESRDTNPLAVVSVTKSFRRPRRPELVALSDVSINVQSGELLCLIGPSGCGKSTLLSLLAGLIEPSHGQVLFHGKSIIGTHPERGMLFQHPALFPWMTVRQNILFGPRAQKQCTAEALQRADELLARVGLAEFGESYPHELSGGMRHRAAFARALINRPEVLLLDEPFGALDAITRASMQELLLDLWTEFRMSIVFVTHDVGEAALLGDRIVLMSPRPGRIHSIVKNPVPRSERVDVDSLTSAALRKDLRSQLGNIMQMANELGVHVPE